MRDLPARLRLVILDLDGVVYRGTQPVEGAADLAGSLRDSGVLVRFATNNSMVARAGYAERLAEMGVACTVDEIVTSASATAEHLRRHEAGVGRVMTVGAAGMLEELRAAGYTAVAAADAVPAAYQGERLAASFDAVVVGLDPAFDYRRLAAAVAAVNAGALLIATNADRRYPTPFGFTPGAGAMVGAIAAATGVEPRLIGKPEPGMFTAILEAAGVEASDAVVIGDNPDADMVAANRAGLASILVLTGVAGPEDVERLRGEQCPTAVAAGPAEVASLLAARLSR